MAETCSKCGKPIVWAVNPATGKRIPVDVRPVVYNLVPHGTGFRAVKIDNQDLIGVSHFATCPHSEFFSGRNKDK